MFCYNYLCNVINFLLHFVCHSSLHCDQVFSDFWLQLTEAFRFSAVANFVIKARLVLLQLLLQTEDS